MWSGYGVDECGHWNFDVWRHSIAVWKNNDRRSLMGKTAIIFFAPICSIHAIYVLLGGSSLVCRWTNWQYSFWIRHKSLWPEISTHFLGHSKSHFMVTHSFCSKCLLFIRIASAVWHGCRCCDGDGPTFLCWDIKRSVNLDYKILFWTQWSKMKENWIMIFQCPRCDWIDKDVNL